MQRLRRELAVLLVVGIFFAGCSRNMGDSSGAKTSSKGGASSTFYHPSPEDIMQDPETGLDITKGILNITFSNSPKIDEAAIKAVISSVDGEIVGQDRAARFYQVRIKNAKTLADLDIVAKKLLVAKGVELVSKNSVSVHSDPFYVR